MNPYTKAARLLILFIGFGILAVALTLLAGDLFIIANNKPPRTLMLALEGFLLILSITILVKSTTMAEYLTTDAGETEEDIEENENQAVDVEYLDSPRDERK